MGEFKSLVLMQLKDKLDWSFLKSKKKTIFKVVTTLLKFAVITALIYFAFYILSYLRLVSLLPGVPLNLFTALLTIMVFLSIIVCSFGLVKTLYHAKDNALLLTLPAKRTTVFTSKLIVYYIYERAFENLDLGYASALAVVLLVVVMIFSLINILCFEKNKYTDV